VYGRNTSGEKTLPEKSVPEKSMPEKTLPEKSRQRTASGRFTVRHHCHDAGFSRAPAPFAAARQASKRSSYLRDFVADVALW
jgi:hypothetical protein